MKARIRDEHKPLLRPAARFGFGEREPNAGARVLGRDSAAEPERGEPAEAMERVLRATWQILDRFHGLVAINTRLPKEELHRKHLPVLERLAPPVKRGQPRMSSDPICPSPGTSRCSSRSSNRHG